MKWFSRKFVWIYYYCSTSEVSKTENLRHPPPILLPGSNLILTSTQKIGHPPPQGSTFIFEKPGKKKYTTTRHAVHYRGSWPPPASFVKAILIYTINPWVLVGCGGLGRAFFWIFIFQFFHFRVFKGDFEGRGSFWPPPSPHRVNSMALWPNPMRTGLLRAFWR